MKHILLMLVALPFVAAIVQSAMSWGSRALSILSSAMASVAAIFLVSRYQPVAGGDLDLRWPWVEYFNISFNLGIDGWSVFPLLLVAVLLPTLIMLYGSDTQGAKGKRALLLLLQSGGFGLATAKDLFLMFFFWSFTVVPIYFLLVVWGEKNRVEAGMRYLVFSAVGSLLFLLAILMIYLGAEPHTFVLSELMGDRAAALAKVQIEVLGVEITLAQLAFALLALGAALRMGIFPFHRGLFAVAEEAPPAVLAVATGFAIPLTLYTFGRVGLELFPTQLRQSSSVVVALGILNLCVGAFYSVGQKSLRGVLASLTLAQAGVLLVGLGSQDLSGWMGSAFHGFAAGLGLAGFAMMVGVIASRSKSADFLDEKGNPVLGGLVQTAPVLGALSALVLCSMLGLPGFAGYVGQALVWIGGTKIHLGVLGAGMVGGLLSLVAIVSVYRSLFLGASRYSGEFQDISPLERAAFFPVLAALVGVGLFPTLLLELIRPTLQTLLSLMTG